MTMITAIVYTAEQAQYATSMTWDGPDDDEYLEPIAVTNSAHALYGKFVTGLGVIAGFPEIAVWLLSLPQESVDPAELFSE